MLEALEPRIAPAAVFHFTEKDGDAITVKTNKGTNDQLAAAITQDQTGTGSFTIDFLSGLDSIQAFAGTNVTVTAKKHGAGDGIVDSMSINAYENALLAIDLGKVSIKGNLLSISAGDGDTSTLAIKSLKVTNFITGTDGNGVESSILGNIGSVSVAKNFNGYINSESDITTGQGTVIGSFSVKGDFAFSTGTDAGHLSVGAINKLTISGTFFGPGDQDIMDNGLIEAVVINKLKIKSMQQGALINLVQTSGSGE